MAVVAIFLQALLQGLHLLRKPVGLLLQSLDQALLLVDHGLLHVDGLLLHTCSFPQGLILLSQVDHFFFWRHDPTLLGSGLSCKPVVLLNSYQFLLITIPFYLVMEFIIPFVLSPRI